MNQELICIESTPALISVNYEEIKEGLLREVKKYDVVVTEDTVKDAKKLATKLNATKNYINTRFKEEITKASAPLLKADEEKKELAGICEEGRQKILVQIAKFDEKTREVARELLAAERESAWQKHGVNDEFRRAEYSDLAIVSAVTKSGNLAASARESLAARIRDDKALQEQTERRLLVLENQSYKAGLTAPLTRDHVNFFLFSDDATYENELKRVLAAEVDRQKKSEEAMRERMDREQKARQKESEQQQEPPSAGPVPADNGPAPVEVSAAEPAPEATRGQPSSTVITCEFHVDVDPAVSEADIKQKFIDKMREAGFTTLASVTVTRQQPTTEAA